MEAPAATPGLTSGKRSLGSQPRAPEKASHRPSAPLVERLRANARFRRLRVPLTTSLGEASRERGTACVARGDLRLRWPLRRRSDSFSWHAYAGVREADRALLAVRRDCVGRHGHRSLRTAERAGGVLAHRRHQAAAPTLREGPGLRLDVPRRGAAGGAHPASERGARRSTWCRPTRRSSSSWSTCRANRSGACSARCER